MAPPDSGPFPENATFVLGAGRFGRRAARILSARQDSPIWIVDRDEQSLSVSEWTPPSRIRMDAFAFLSDNFHSLLPSHRLVPCIPVHVAFQWLARTCAGKIRRETVEAELWNALPNPSTASDDSLLASYADFLCPEDCPEPSDHCTWTGEKRESPLFELIRGIEIPDHHTHVIRSRQLAPGVGGYRFADLMRLLEEVERNPPGKWLLGTACRCHGIVTAFSVRAETQRR